MKWIDGETWESIKKRKENWHRWFVWYPVSVSEITVKGKIRKIKVWMEYVERKGVYDYNWGSLASSKSWKYEYREINKSC